DTMLKDGQVTATATYDQYLTVLSQIEQIRNEKISAAYATKAQTVAEQMGYSNISY
ncbi:TPA: hypothetical protein KTW54_003204, partial [Enterococcus faecium]|nr:hypothetical protein [Enterococcus faecium]